MKAKPEWRRWRAEVRPYRRLTAGAVAAVAVEVSLLAVTPLIVSYAIDGGAVERNLGVVTTAVVALIGVYAAHDAAMWVQTRTVGRLAQTYLKNLRTRLLRQLFALDLDYLDGEQSGKVVSRLTSDVESVQQFLEAGAVVVLRAALLVTLTLSLLATQSTALVLLVAVCVSPFAVATWWYQQRSRERQRAVREHTAELLGYVNESLVGMRVVKAYTAEDLRHRTFVGLNARTYLAKVDTVRVDARYVAAADALQPLSLGLVITGGALLVSSGRASVGAVVAAGMYLGRLFEPLQQVSQLGHLFQAAAAGHRRISELLTRRPKVVDRDGAAGLPPGPGALELRNVSFRYGDGPEILSDLSLGIASGRRVAVVGPSGSGKTTLAGLVARFHDPTAGSVTVDGVDLRDVSQSLLRREVVLVPQDGYLFDGTIAENIAVAREDADRADVEAACAGVGVLDRLQALPGGLDTAVSNRGLSLSAGQRQLVALARAFLAAPRVLILDEATSSLDPVTDDLVEQALEDLLHDRTSIVIAHRVSTALRADRIVLLEAGRVVLDGPPADVRHDPAFTRWAAEVVADEPAA